MGARIGNRENCSTTSWRNLNEEHLICFDRKLTHLVLPDPTITRSQGHPQQAAESPIGLVWLGGIPDDSF